MRIRFKNLFLFFSFAGIFAVIFYSRFVNLQWGLPFPFHPDERNIADALVRLGCRGGVRPDGIITYFLHCFDPHFYAYGQFSLFFGYLIQLARSLYIPDRELELFAEAVRSLRIIAAFSSVATAWVVYKTILQIFPEKTNRDAFFIRPVLFFTVSFYPAAIQYAHFGTTESLLMLLYQLLLYISLSVQKEELSTSRYGVLSGWLVGCAVAVKVSGLSFAALPIFVIFFINKTNHVKSHLQSMFWRIGIFFLFGISASFVAVFFSPFNILNFPEFLSSMIYETAVGRGALEVFYTRQFTHSIPLFFSLQKSVPYALGIVPTILFFISIIFIRHNRSVRLVWLAAIIAFLPGAILFAKWSRFIAPFYPVAITLGGVCVLWLFRSFAARSGIFLLFIPLVMIVFTVQGIAYVSIFQHEDVRMEASAWMYEHIPDGAIILSETANVVDLPLPGTHETGTPTPNYQVLSFNSYDLDTDPVLAGEFEEHIAHADYIVVPSRRVFANHTCIWPDSSYIRSFPAYEWNRCDTLAHTYPLLSRYYTGLFSGTLGFEPIAEFHSYPRITFFGKTLALFPDERAEETWTVFDHPVVRIFKRSL